MQQKSKPHPAGKNALAILLSFVLVFGISTYSADVVRAQYADETRVERMTRWSIGDARDWIATSDLRRLTHTTIALAALAPLSLLDERIANHTERADGRYGKFLERTNELGGPKAILVPTSLFAVSFLSESPKFQDAAFTSLQATGYAYVLTVITKRVLLGRARPEDGKGPHEFRFFSNENSSFPSGHSTTAWAIVTPWMMYYPNPVMYSLVLVSSGTAMSRMKRQKHWMTDVVAGSALGFITGYWLSKKHMGETGNLSFSLSPGVEGATLSLKYAIPRR